MSTDETDRVAARSSRSTADPRASARTGDPRDRSDRPDADDLSDVGGPSDVGHSSHAEDPSDGGGEPDADDLSVGRDLPDGGDGVVVGDEAMSPGRRRLVRALGWIVAFALWSVVCFVWLFPLLTELGLDPTLGG